MYRHSPHLELKYPKVSKSDRYAGRSHLLSRGSGLSVVRIQEGTAKRPLVSLLFWTKRQAWPSRGWYVAGALPSRGAWHWFCFGRGTPPFRGPRVGVSPNIHTRTDRTWPVVHTCVTATAKHIHDDALDRHGAPLPLGGNTSHGTCR